MIPIYPLDEILECFLYIVCMIGINQIIKTLRIVSERTVDLEGRCGGTHETIEGMKKLTIVMFGLVIAIIVSIGCLSFLWHEYNDGQTVHTDLYSMVHELQRRSND